MPLIADFPAIVQFATIRWLDVAPFIGPRMKRSIFLMFSIVSGTDVASEFARSPESLVIEFIHDYHQWNAEALKLESNLPPTEGMNQAEIAYSKLLQKFCRPGFKGKAIAFGSESSHSPDLEEIVSKSVSEATAIVQTRAKSPSVAGFIADYEYHLAHISGRWYLTEIYYVDSDGKYEGL